MLYKNFHFLSKYFQVEHLSNIFALGQLVYLLEIKEVFRNFTQLSLMQDSLASIFFKKRLNISGFSLELLHMYMCNVPLLDLFYPTAWKIKTNMASLFYICNWGNTD